MLCYAVLCYAVLCYATLRCATLRYATLCYAMLRCAALRYAMLCYADQVAPDLVTFPTPTLPPALETALVAEFTARHGAPPASRAEVVELLRTLVEGQDGGLGALPRHRIASHRIA